MSTKGKIKATWVGPYGHRLADGTLLDTGVTVCELPEAEARASANWQVGEPAPRAKRDDSKGSTD